MQQGPLLQVRNLTVKIAERKLLLNAISFTLHKGEIFALVGESGSGKSLTAFAINRLLADNIYIASGSEIILAEQDLLRLTASQMQAVRRQQIGMIFQDPGAALNPVMSIGAQVAESILINHPGLRRAPLKQRMMALLHQVQLPDPHALLALYPHQLSGGLKQRVVIALALAKSPCLLIADEATTALDVTTQAQILSLIKTLNREMQMSILLITHDLGIVAKMADTVAVLQQGRMIETASAQSFFAAPAQLYSQQLLQAVMAPQAKLNTPASKTEIILQVDQLSVIYPGPKRQKIKAIDKLSFTLQRGKTLALVGESGCGKTTLAKAILQLVPYHQGEIAINGNNIKHLRAAQLKKMRADCQMIFQDPFASMDPRYKVKDIILEGMIALGIGSKAEWQATIVQLLHQVGLTSDLQGRYMHELSGGQRQRVAIARALAVGAELLLCDEPTSALDVSMQNQVLQLLNKLQRDLGLSIVLITHNIAILPVIADYVAVLYLGRIIEYGRVEQVLFTPRHPYTQALLAAVPTLAPQANFFQPLGGEPPSAMAPPQGCHFAPRCPKVHARCLGSYPQTVVLADQHQVSCYLY